jgi:hypothetical protein
MKEETKNRFYDTHPVIKAARDEVAGRSQEDKVRLFNEAVKKSSAEGVKPEAAKAEEVKPEATKAESVKPPPIKPPPPPVAPPIDSTFRVGLNQKWF